MTQHELAFLPAADASLTAGQLDRAIAAYLTRFTGSSREHARSDLRCFLAWCCDRHPDPPAARRPHLELYIRWMQEIRRPAVPPESPTLGFTHLQFEAMLTASRESPNPCDFALVALLGLRIFEATSANIAEFGEEHGHRVLRVCGNAPKLS
jgi:integrase/recombinase XerD